MSLPIKELKRRRLQSALTVLSLAVCVSVATSLVLFSESLGIQISGFSAGGLNNGFSVIFSRFLFIVVLLSCVAGVLIVYFLMSQATSERTRDIGIMKAVGCLTDAIFKHFAVELFILVLGGCFVGSLAGICLYFASTGIMNLLGFNLPTSSFDLQAVLLIFSLFAGFSFILGLRLTARAARVKPAEALAQASDATEARQSNLGSLFFHSKNLSARVAFRTLGRRWSMTVRSVTCLSVVMVLISVIVVGGIVAEETMLSYVQRAVGTNVVLVARAEVAERYVDLLERFLQSNMSGSFDYLNAEYAIPSSVLAEVQGVSGVAKVDPRLIMEGALMENQYIYPDPDNEGQYVVVGSNRQSNIVVVGVHPGSLVSDWLLDGEGINDDSPYSVLMGESLAATCFDDPFTQSFRAFGRDFGTVGVCLDTMNNGMVVYVPFGGLSSVVNCSSYNVVLVQIDSSSFSEAFQEIESVASSHDLVAVNLNQTLDKQVSFASQIWASILSLSLLSFLSAVTSLVGFLMLSVSGQQRDLGIMRALGAKPGTILKVVALQTFILVLLGAVFGVPIGVAVALTFLIPEPVVSQNAAAAIVLLVSGMVAALCLSSLYPGRKAARTPIVPAVSRA